MKGLPGLALMTGGPFLEHSLKLELIDEAA
jgi:hypothetical protein